MDADTLGSQFEIGKAARKALSRCLLGNTLHKSARLRPSWHIRLLNVVQQSAGFNRPQPVSVRRGGFSFEEMSVGWKYADIAIERGAKAGERFKDASREELLQRIVDLETQLYPLYVALSPITEKSWRGTGVSSMLFPLRPEEHDDKFFVYNSETKKSDIVDIAEKDLHSAGYYTEDGLTIKDGANLHDDFEIISFHQSAPACYVGNGSVFVGDIRRLIEVFNGPYREAQP